MNILIIGAGVIGTTYGWQLSEVGNNVTILAREKRFKELKKMEFVFAVLIIEMGKKILRI